MSAPTTTRPEGAPSPDEARRGSVAPLVALGLLAVTVAVMLGLEAAGVQPDGMVVHGAAAWVAAAAVVVVGLGLLVHGLLRETSWKYPDGAKRDLRIDMLRGVAIVFIVVNHLELPSLFHLVSQETIGTVSGAELFVAMSGVVLGMVYRQRLERSDLLDATSALLARAWKLYRTALAVVLSVYLLTLVPGVDGEAVTTFDLGGGEVSDTYPNVERLADYPVPGWFLRDLLLLELGPWQFNVMGLYVVLLLSSPLLIAALRRRLVLVVLAVSWGLYALNSVTRTRVFTSQFEDPFPLLTWQVLFVTGLAIGWYRTSLLELVRRPVGRVLLVLFVVGHLAALLLAASHSYLSSGYDVRLDLLAPATFDAFYAEWFDRRTLGIGRLLDVWLLLATAYGLLTAYWRPLSAALGWLLVPLGQASLYVFVLHVPAALIVANVPGLDEGSVALGTLAHGIVLAVLWAMVRRRVLYRFIPH